jgi:murein L,D-transpeptidase YcbB/YkuD
MLSDGLLKLVRDISIGRLDPKTVDPKWSIPRIPFDAALFLQRALSENYFAASLHSLIPTSDQYRQLTEAAVRYQKIINRGSWEKIPEDSKLRVGDDHPNISLIRNRLAIENRSTEIPDSWPDPEPLSIQNNIYDKQLEKTVKQFQRRHSLYPDGVVGPATLLAINVSAKERLQQIIINLERLRWLPDDLGRRYIMVNLANYRLKAVEDDKVKLNMRVIVGKTKRSTPSFSSQMTHVVLNPRWYIPNKLARIDLLPKQQQNPNYFDRFNIRVFGNENGKRTEINPDTIDWHSISNQHFPYSLVQDPGKRNALGRIKFIVPNPWSIYLHDTPSKNLFDRSKRTFSSGCIRVEDPYALAEFSLNGKNIHQSLLDYVENDKSYSTKLDQPLSVYAIYATVWLNDDELIFSPDNYKRDVKMAKYL